MWLLHTFLFFFHLHSQGCVETPDIFSARTENRELGDCEEILAEFDKKYINSAYYNFKSGLHFFYYKTLVLENNIGQIRSDKGKVSVLYSLDVI